MMYSVRPGDTLWGIAGRFFASPQQWPENVRDNGIVAADRIWVGQPLYLRDSLIVRRSTDDAGSLSRTAAPHQAQTLWPHAPSLVPGRAFFFVLADEINPLTKKVVRKVMVNPSMASELSVRLGRPVAPMPNPARFGLHPTDPTSKLPAGRHVLGMKPSPFSSASTRPFGAPRFEGSRFWIDVEKAKAAGATFHGIDEISADLDRIAAKTANAAERAKVEKLKALARADGEVLVRGPVPASAVKGAGAMALTRGLQGVQIIGFAMTAVDLTRATEKSISQQSVKPVAAESIRQVGGWAAAWAGMKLGAAGGAALGIETGPGALISGVIGGLVGGVAGYYGADWIADHVDAN